MYQTNVGGIFTAIIGLLIVWILVIQMNLMVNFGNDTITTNDTKTDFKDLGVVTLEDLNYKNPVLGIYHKGLPLKSIDEKICGGSCLAFLYKHVYFGLV